VNPPIYYMRDNHTFRPLPENVDAALHSIGQELDAGFTCGMLCTKREGANPRLLHFRYQTPRADMLVQAREWLKAEIMARRPTAQGAAGQEGGTPAEGGANV
jgi:hypothetical protein